MGFDAYVDLKSFESYPTKILSRLWTSCQKIQLRESCKACVEIVPKNNCEKAYMTNLFNSGSTEFQENHDARKLSTKLSYIWKWLPNKKHVPTRTNVVYKNETLEPKKESKHIGK